MKAQVKHDAQVISRMMRKMIALGRFIQRGIPAAEKAGQSCVSASRSVRAEWPRRAFSLCVLCVFAVILPGCVSAHKKGRTIHELWKYQLTPQPNGYVTALPTWHEIWEDEYKGGAVAFLSDPTATQLSSTHTNQTALGGASALTIGSLHSEVSTNGIIAVGNASSQIIQGIGSATGQLINKSVTGTPTKQ